MYFILIQPVFSEHLSFVTLFKCSLGRLHKTYVWLYINNLRLRHFLEASNNFYNGNMVAIVCVFLLIIYILTCHQITSKQINKMKWYINIDILLYTYTVNDTYRKHMLTTVLGKFYNCTSRESKRKQVKIARFLLKVF